MTTTTGRRLFTDEDLAATLDQRARQLEGELALLDVQLVEVGADPHVPDADRETFAQQVARARESLVARLDAVRILRDDLDAPTVD